MENLTFAVSPVTISLSGSFSSDLIFEAMAAVRLDIPDLRSVDLCFAIVVANIPAR